MLADHAEDLICLTRAPLVLIRREERIRKNFTRRVEKSVDAYLWQRRKACSSRVAISQEHYNGSKTRARPGPGLPGDADVVGIAWPYAVTVATPGAHRPSKSPLQDWPKIACCDGEHRGEKDHRDLLGSPAGQ
jgi:hypothetical protein